MTFRNQAGRHAGGGFADPGTTLLVRVVVLVMLVVRRVEIGVTVLVRLRRGMIQPDQCVVRVVVVAVLVNVLVCMFVVMHMGVLMGVRDIAVPVHVSVHVRVLVLVPVDVGMRVHRKVVVVFAHVASPQPCLGILPQP